MVKRAPTKYGNTRGGCLLGHSHRSQLEVAVCNLGFFQIKAKEIQSVQAEVHVKICGSEGHDCTHSGKVELVVDFKLTRPDGTHFYREAKGMETDAYRIKRRLWIHNQLGRLEVWCGTAARPFLKEVIGE